MTSPGVDVPVNHELVIIMFKILKIHLFDKNNIVLKVVNCLCDKISPSEKDLFACLILPEDTHFIGTQA